MGFVAAKAAPTGVMSVCRVDLQRGPGRLAALQGLQGDRVRPDDEGALSRHGVQFEVPCVARGRGPAQGDHRIAGPDALHVGRAARVVDQFQVLDAAGVGELRGLPRRQFDAGAIGDARQIGGWRRRRCGAGGEDDSGDGGQQTHVSGPDLNKLFVFNAKYIQCGDYVVDRVALMDCEVTICTYQHQITKGCFSGFFELG